MSTYKGIRDRGARSGTGNHRDAQTSPATYVMEAGASDLYETQSRKLELQSATQSCVISRISIIST